jgi:DNA-binding CsgD family transcriptional regulator
LNATLLSGERVSPLLRGLDDSFRGHGGVAVIVGAMASGKTTLLHAFCDQAAQQGATVLAATASQEEECLQFGVVRQILDQAPVPLRAAADEQTGQPAPVCQPGSEPGAHLAPSTVDIAYALGTGLLALPADRPVVLAIDDAQFLDAASLQCILVTARRVHCARMLIVAANCSCPQHGCRRFVGRIDRLSRVRHVRLGRLTVTDVEVALRERLGDAVTAAMARSCHEISGGNLLLVDALAQETAASGQAGPGPVRPGRTFADAVLACVGRCSPERLAVLHTTALLGGTASMAQIASIAGLDRGAVTAHLHTLEAAGLLTKGRCRHPAIVAAVTESMPVEQRRATHQRFAQLLYDEDAPATAIAGQLVAAGLPELPWATEIFRMAADGQARHDPPAALRYLKAARRLPQNEDERAGLTMTLASLGWRTNPGAVRRYLPELVHALRSGCLSRADAELTIRYLLWYGRIDEAADALGRLLASVPPGEPELAVELRPFVLWLCIWYPGVVRRVPAAGELRFSEALRSEAAGAQPVAAGNVFDLMIRNGEGKEIAAEAGRLLESWRLADHTLDSLITALVGLLIADELDYATRWCDALVREAEERGAWIWCAQLTAVRAEVAFRQGRTAAAAGHAASAHAQVPAEDWGVWAGLPLSTLVRANTVLGAYDRAAEMLDQPVPTEMFETTFGLLYLQARGQYLLATGDPQRARVEFQAGWDFTRRHGVELPSILPWRVYLAEARVQLGELAAAGSPAGEQMALTAEGAQCLSTAEQRVAMRAAEGLTNAQIAHRLFLTVSTVEQHLTHIYRKLNIAGRVELASVLGVPAQPLQLRS